MRNFIAKSFFLLAVIINLVTFLLAYHYGFNIELALTLSGIIIIVITLFLERYMPYKKAWNRSQKDTVTDITSAAVLLVAVEPMIKWLTPVALVFVLGATSLSLPLFPTKIPISLQIMLALLMAEFLSYWSHRWHHQINSLWWLHAMHHSSERMYVINAMRFHPLNCINNYLITIVPMLLIGVPEEVILAQLALAQPVLLLQHANIDLRSGFVNYLFNTNEVHKWHHSSQSGEANCNYGRALMIWDQLLGTFYFKRNKTPARVGLFSDSAARYPSERGYFSQFFSMFNPSLCCR